MEKIFLEIENDLSDEDEEEVLRSIALQKSLISQSRSIIGGLSRDCLPASLGEQNDSTGLSTPIAVEETDNPYSDALAANLEYDRYLAKLETNLKALIDKCKIELSNLESFQHDERGWHNSTQAFGRGSHVYSFGAPFFKDEKFYKCPPNADTVSRMQQGEFMMINLPKVRWWMQDETKAIVEAIKKRSEELCKQDAVLKRSALVQKYKALEGNSEEKKKLKEEILNFSIDDYVSSHLNEKIGTIDHDWMHLSATVLKGRKSAGEIRAFWHTYLNPKYSKEKWTKDEDSKLRSVAENNGCQDWDLIAEQLQTGRSGYQCFCQFKGETVEATIAKKWTKEEDKQLMAVVEKLRTGDFIPWSKVAMHIKGRSREQVYNRWEYSLDPMIKKGRFTAQEDIIILRGVQKWGTNFQKIASYMPDRRSPQIRVRYHTSLSQLHIEKPWTPEEDKLLLDLGEKNEGKRKWSQMLEHFSGKTASKLRVRYEFLKRWERANPERPERAVVTRKKNAKENLYNSHPEMWAYADQLLSSANLNPSNHSVSLCAPIAQPPKLVVSRKSPKSPIDVRLEEYFRKLHGSPTTTRFTSLPECDPVLIRDVAAFLEILGARLNIPADVLDDDQLLDPEDRQILQGLRSAHPKVLAPQPGLEVVTLDEDPSTINIDYIPSTDPSSTVVSLNLSHLPQPAVPLCRPRHPVYGLVSYLCPPNTSTLTGLLTILMTKSRLVDTVDDTDTLSQGDEENDAFRKANQLWEDRLMCLFALSHMLHSLDHEEDPGARGSSEDSGPATNGVFDVDRTLVMENGAVHVLTGKRKARTSKKTPKKRAKKK